MRLLSVIYGSKLPYWVTFVIDKFTIRELCNQIGNKIGSITKEISKKVNFHGFVNIVQCVIKVTYSYCYVTLKG